MASQATMVAATLARRSALPALFQAVPESGRRFWEFFTVHIRNPHTRRAYFKAVESFAAWCAERVWKTLPG